MEAEPSQLPGKPDKFYRTTHRQTRTRFDKSAGFQSLNLPPILLLRRKVNALLLEQHMDNDFRFAAGTSVLISVHSSRERALRFARMQKTRLFKDGSYSDPDVRVYEISTDTLQWKTIALRSPGLQSIQMQVLRDSISRAIFFSTSEAIRRFGVKSQWITLDEWFAVGRIPACLAEREIEPMDGLLPRGKPYKLVPVPSHLIPTNLVMIPSLDIFSWWGAEAEDERRSDEAHQEAMRRECRLDQWLVYTTVKFVPDC